MGIAAHFEVDEDGLAPREPRRTLFLEARGKTATGEAAVTVHNISVTGMLLETALPLAEGETINVELPHAGKTGARIVWVNGDFKGCAFASALSQASVAAAQLRSTTPPDTYASPDAPDGEMVSDNRTAMRRKTGDANLGARIQRLRKERGLTLSELARRLNVSKPTVWAWEQGKARPVETRYAALASVLGVEASELNPRTVDGEAREVLERARRQIAVAYGTCEDQVRIMIEL